MRSSKILSCVCGTLFLLASVPALADYYPDHAEATKTTVTVNVEWQKDEATTDAKCNSFMGKPPSLGPEVILGCYYTLTSTIYVVQPTSFNDIAGLMILGHEFWHALGADHP